MADADGMASDARPPDTGASGVPSIPVWWDLLEDMARRAKRNLPPPVDPARYVAAYTSLYNACTEKRDEKFNIADVYSGIQQTLANVCEHCVARIPNADIRFVSVSLEFFLLLSPHNL